jgi:hypothetical protein
MSGRRLRERIVTKRARVGAAAFAAVLCAGAVAATSGPAGASPAAAAGSRAAGSGAAVGRGGQGGLIPGNLLVSESYYSNDPGIVAGQT